MWNFMFAQTRVRSQTVRAPISVKDRDGGVCVTLVMSKCKIMPLRSTAVLHWLSHPAKRYHVYVATRVQRILSHSDVSGII